MVSIAISEQGIKESFSKAKNDILNLKRAINRQIIQQEETSKEISQLATKEEFYSFVKALREKLDAIEGNLVSKEKAEEAEKWLKEEIKSLRKEFSRIDSLRDELLEARKIKDSFAKLEAKAVEKTELSSDLKKINSEIAEIRKELSRTGKLVHYKEELDEIRKGLSKLEKQNALLTDLFTANKRMLEAGKKTEKEIEEIKKGISRLFSDYVRKEDHSGKIFELRSAAEKLEKDILRLGDVYASKKELAKRTDYLAEELAKTKKLMNEIKGSEVVVEELVTKKQLAAALKKEHIREPEKRTKDYETKIPGINRETKELKEKISELKENISLNSKKADEKISEVRNDVVIAVKRLVSDLDKRLIDRIKSETSKEGRADAELLSELNELKKKVSKLEGKSDENIKEELGKKLEELEESLLEQIEKAASAKVKELESRFEPVDKFKTDIDKKFSRIESKIDEEKGFEEIEKRLKAVEEKGLKEIEKRINDAEEKSLKETEKRLKVAEEKSAARLKEIDSKLKQAEAKFPEYKKVLEKIKGIEEQLVEAEELDELEKGQEKTRKEVQEIIKLNIRETEKLRSEIEKIREQLKAKTAPKELKELSDMRKEVDYLLNNVVTNPDMDAQITPVEQKLGELKKELKGYNAASLQKDNEILKRMAVIEKKISEEKAREAKKEKPERGIKKEEKPGFLKGIFSGIADFFREEEKEEEKKEEKIEIKEIREIREARKEARKEEKEKTREEEKEEEKKEEKIKEKPETLKYILVGFIALLLIGGAAYYLLLPKKPEFTPDEACISSYECQKKEEGRFWFDCKYDNETESCKCFVGELEQCNAAKVAELSERKEKKLPSTVYSLLDYKFYILGILIVMLLIIYLISRSPKEKEMEEEEETEEAIDLEEFLGKGAKEKKKEEQKKKEEKKSLLAKIKDFFFEEE